MEQSGEESDEATEQRSLGGEGAPPSRIQAKPPPAAQPGSFRSAKREPHGSSAISRLTAKRGGVRSCDANE